MNRRQFIAGVLAIAVVPGVVEGFNPFDTVDVLTAFKPPRPVYTIGQAGVYRVSFLVAYDAPEIEASVMHNGKVAWSTESPCSGVLAGHVVLHLDDGDQVGIETSVQGQTTFRVMRVD